jgi:3-isopropylmalate/(R)-2-methylmalate dehydratase large subunit
MVAMPPSPADAVPLSALPATVIHQAYIGACTGAKLYDLEQAARVARGRRVAPGVRLVVAPASVETYRHALERGIIADLAAAGALVVATGCGACAGLGVGVLGPGEVCVSSTNRNYPGRMAASSTRASFERVWTPSAGAYSRSATMSVPTKSCPVGTSS